MKPEHAMLLCLGVSCFALTLFAAWALVEARRRRRARRWFGRPPLEFTERPRIMWCCTMCGLRFAPFGPPGYMPSECPNPRCRTPWTWSTRRFDA